MLNKTYKLVFSDNGRSEWDGPFPLHAALMRDDKITIHNLIQETINLDVQNESGWSPLHVAVRQGASCTTVTSLVSPSNRDMQDIQGRTPLHDALCNENYDSDTLQQIVSTLVCVSYIFGCKATFVHYTQ